MHVQAQQELCLYSKTRVHERLNADTGPFVAAQTRVGVQKRVCLFASMHARAKMGPRSGQREAECSDWNDSFLEGKPKSSRTRPGPQRDYEEAAAGD